MPCSDKQPTNAQFRNDRRAFGCLKQFWNSTITYSSPRTADPHCRRDTSGLINHASSSSNRVVPAPRPNAGAPPEQHPRNGQHGHGDEAEQARGPADPQPVVHLSSTFAFISNASSGNDRTLLNTLTLHRKQRKRRRNRVPRDAVRRHGAGPRQRAVRVHDVLGRADLLVASAPPKKKKR